MGTQAVRTRDRSLLLPERLSIAFLTTGAPLYRAPRVTVEENGIYIRGPDFPCYGAPPSNSPGERRFSVENFEISPGRGALARSRPPHFFSPAHTFPICDAWVCSRGPILVSDPPIRPSCHPPTPIIRPIHILNF